MKKYLIRGGLLAAFFGAGVILLGGGCGWAGIKTVRGIMGNKAGDFKIYYPVVRWCTNGLPVADKLDKILNGTYLVLLQNNMELRATGGFPGSYARVTFKDGGLKSMEVEDLYQPDGQIKGHVEPPYPIQEAFLQGWFRLRDANWDPDYATAAAVMDWFFEQGGEEKVDGIIAVNLGLLTKWLEIMGPVKVITFGETVTANNLYQLAQTYAENRIYGNVTLKREFIGAAGAALWERTKAASPGELVKLGEEIYSQMKQKQILVWMKDPQVQADVVRMGFDGGLTSGWEGSGDYLYVVDSNMTANKADCCIRRQVKMQVEKDGNEARETILLEWKNENESRGARPVFYGGIYNDYVRVVLPLAGTDDLKVRVGDRVLRKATAEDFRIPASMRKTKSMDMYAVEERKGPDGSKDLQIVGFWLPTIDLGETMTAEVQIKSTRNPPGKFKIWVKRQPGVESLDLQVVGNGKILQAGKIYQDQSFLWEL